MKCEVEFTDEFYLWWEGLTEDEQDEIAAVVHLLEEEGVHLRFPRSSKVNGSRHSHLRELRIQYRGDPYRVLYAFDPRQNAILLLGGNKKGDDDWYRTNVPIADDIYDTHLAELAAEAKEERGR